MKSKLVCLPFFLASFVCHGQGLTDTTDPFDSIYEEARSTLPDAPITDAFFTVAKARAASGNGSFDNIGQLANYLADDYSLHVRMQREIAKPYCENKGIEIGPFLDALDRVNADDARIVEKIYARLGNSYEPVWAMLKESASRNTEVFMQMIARVTDTAEDTACTQLQMHPVESAQRLGYANLRASRGEILRTLSP
jgi:hypothetical protein